MERDTEKRGREEMKGIKFVVSILVIVSIFVGFNTVLTFADNTIVRECEVECLVDNVVYFCDTYGNIWGWECGKHEGYHLGQKVRLIMNTNNTKDVKDDFILKIRLDKSK